MEAIQHIAPLLPSVGRIAGRGSCVVLSMTPDPNDTNNRRCVLLTTSHVINKRVHAHGLEAVFFEHPMQGSNARTSSSSMLMNSTMAGSTSGNSSSRVAAGSQQQPVVVLLRPEHVFLTSAEDPKAKQAQQTQSVMDMHNKQQNSGNNSNNALEQSPSPQRNNNINSSSASTTQQQQQQSESIGYTIVACDVEGRFFEAADDADNDRPNKFGYLAKYRMLQQQQQQQQQQLAGQTAVSPYAATEEQLLQQQNIVANIGTAIPIGLPLVQSRCPTVKKGDTHLVVTHASGGPTRKIYTLTVGETYDNYCVYNEVDTTVMFSSGGLVFSTAGDFIGLQHQSPGPECSHYCMFIKDITQHLFLSHSLSLVQVPILDGNVEDIGGMVGNVAKSVFDRDLYVLGEEPMWKRQRDALIRGNPIDRDMQARAPQGGILTHESRQLHVREKARYGGNFSQLVDYDELQREQRLRQRYVPPTLLVCDHLEVFKQYYEPGNYASLVHMVGCFGYHPQLTKLILTRLISHEHRNDLVTFSEYQGMPPLLELLERNSGNGDIIQAGITALGRLTQFDLNREALNRYNGLQTLLSLLAGWPNHSNIIDWGCFCLMNMSSRETLRAKENIKTISESGGIEMLVGFVRDLGIKGPRSGHIVRWGLQALSNCVGEDKGIFDKAIEAGACGVVFDAIAMFTDDTYCLLGPALCFYTLVHVEIFDAAVDYFISAGALSIVVSILQGIGATSGGAATDAQVAQHLLMALQHIVEQRPHRNVAGELVRLRCVEAAASCAKVFAKEGDLVNVVAALVSTLSE